MLRADGTRGQTDTPLYHSEGDRLNFQIGRSRVSRRWQRISPLGSLESQRRQIDRVEFHQPDGPGSSSESR